MPEFVFRNKEFIEIYSLENCPPAEASPKNITAYRFVYNPITRDSFKNQIEIGNPPRGTEAKHITCMRCGLSMFEDIDSAILKYKALPRKNIIKYTHIAKGDIETTHGICTPSNKGHFTLHEYAGIELEKSFSIIQEL